MVETFANSRGTPSIGTTAAVVGSISFAAGFIGPVLFSDSNLGPLLGIFVTGPLGVLAGGLVGILLSARAKAGQPQATEIKWLLLCWLGTLLFTFAASVGGIGLLSIAAQLAVILCAAILFFAMPTGLPYGVRRWRLLVLVALGAALLTSMFPPTVSMAEGGLHLRFFLDPGFDASTNVPAFAVNQTVLLAEWLFIIGLVVLVVLVDRARALTDG